MIKSNTFYSLKFLEEDVSLLILHRTWKLKNRIITITINDSRIFQTL